VDRQESWQGSVRRMDRRLGRGRLGAWIRGQAGVWAGAVMSLDSG
jgi:hypothetical protein